MVRVVLGLLILTTVTLEFNTVTGPDVSTSPLLVAVEDDSFYSDNGVNVAALLRGLWGYLQGSDTGGSTIEIQLAHMLYPADTTGLWGRVHLVTTALEFDGHYTKLAILSMYLDAAYFGHGFFGIDAASAGYFGVRPAQLSGTQAAMLAGLVQAPSALDPFAHLHAATQRMNYVLQRLVETGQLTQVQARDASQAPLNLRKSA